MARAQAIDGSDKSIKEVTAPKHGDVLEYSATEDAYVPTQLNPNHVLKYETLTTAAASKAVDLELYQTKIVTGHATGALTMGNGLVIGQRKLLTLQTVTTPGDVVNFTEAEFSQGVDSIQTIVLDAANEFMLLEWRGTTWEIIKATSGVVTLVP